MMALFLPVIVFLPTLIYTVLSIKEKRIIEDRYFVTLLLKYGALLMFAIVECLYLWKKTAGLPVFLILYAIDAAAAVLMGTDLLKVCRAKELNEETAMMMLRSSGYIMLAVFGFIVMLIMVP